jgi:putative transcriptional regulator
VLLVLCPALVLAALAPAKRTPPPPPAAHVVQQGQLLVAGRSMQDPRFRRTVIYVLRHGSEGSLGLVINRATGITLSHALPDLKDIDKRQHLMYYGGPVLPERLWVLFRHAAPPETAEHVQADIHFAGLQATLEALLAEDLDATRLRVYFGHAGWAPGQLAHELARGDWHVRNSLPQQVFSSAPDALWHELIEQLDPPGRLTCHACRYLSTAPAGR